MSFTDTSWEYFLIEHPTRGVLSDESEPYRGNFRWHWSTPRGSEHDWKFATVALAQKVLSQLPENIGRKCYIITSARDARGNRWETVVQADQR